MPAWFDGSDLWVPVDGNVSVPSFILLSKGEYSEEGGEQPEPAIAPKVGGLGRVRQSAKCRSLEERWISRRRQEEQGSDEEECDDGLVWDVVDETEGESGGRGASLAARRLGLGFGRASLAGGTTW